MKAEQRSAGVGDTFSFLLATRWWRRRSCVRDEGSSEVIDVGFVFFLHDIYTKNSPNLDT